MARDPERVASFFKSLQSSRNLGVGFLLTQSKLCYMLALFLAGPPSYGGSTEVVPTSASFRSMTRMLVQNTWVFFVPVGGPSNSSLFLCWYEDEMWHQTTVEVPANSSRTGFFGVRDSDRFVHVDSWVNTRANTIRFFRLRRDPWRFEFEETAATPAQVSGVRAIASDRNAVLVTESDGGFVVGASVARAGADPMEIGDWPATYFHPLGWSNGEILGVAFGRVLMMRSETGDLALEEPAEIIGYGRCYDSHVYSVGDDGESIWRFNPNPDFREWEPFASIESFGGATPRCARSGKNGDTVIFNLDTSMGLDILVGFDREGNQLFGWPSEGFPIQAVSDDGRYAALYGRLGSRHYMLVTDTRSGDTAYLLDRLTQAEFVTTADNRVFLVLANWSGSELRIQELGGESLKDTVDPEVVVSPNPYELWAIDNIVGSFEDEDAEPDGDGDDDGLSNSMEFALGGSLTKNDRSLLPVVRRLDGESAFEFSYRRRDRLDSRVRYIIEASPDLGDESWTSNGVTIEKGGPQTDNGDGTHTVTVRITPAQAVAKLYSRLRIEIDMTPN